MFATGSFLTLYNGMMDVGDRYASARNIALDLGNDGAGHDIVTDAGTGSMRVCWQGRQ